MDPYIGEIRMFAGNFAPRGWAFCSGQVLSIAQNTALFSLLGTTYGGNGQTNFALPNLQGRVPVQPGQAPGLSPYTLGEMSGEPNHTLTQNEIPAHNHAVMASSTAGSESAPGPNTTWGTSGRGRPAQYGGPADTSMAASAMAPTGGSQPHNNMQPYLAVSFIIALQGIYPPRS